MAETYNSLQQEVEVKTKKLKKVKNSFSRREWCIGSKCVAVANGLKFRSKTCL